MPHGGATGCNTHCVHRARDNETPIGSAGGVSAIMRSDASKLAEWSVALVHSATRDDIPIVNQMSCY